MRFFQKKTLLICHIDVEDAYTVGGQMCLLVQVILWYTQYLIIMRRKHSKN